MQNFFKTTNLVKLIKMKAPMVLIPRCKKQFTAHVAIYQLYSHDQQGVKCVAQDVVTRTEAYGEGWGIYDLLIQAQQCI